MCVCVCGGGGGGGGYEYVSYALGGSGGMLPPPPPPPPLPRIFFLCSETVSGKNYDYRYRASIQVLGIAPNFLGLIIFVIFREGIYIFCHALGATLYGTSVHIFKGYSVTVKKQQQTNKLSLLLSSITYLGGRKKRSLITFCLQNCNTRENTMEGG